MGGGGDAAFGLRSLPCSGSQAERSAAASLPPVFGKDFTRSSIPAYDDAIADIFPQAYAQLEQLQQCLANQQSQLVFFFDYDGTLSPIVPDPERAVLPEVTRAALRRLSEVYTVAIVSGRSLKKVRAFVQLDTLFYAGSHGFDIEGPVEGEISVEGQECRRLHHQVAADFLPTLEDAVSRVEKLLVDFRGAHLENHKFTFSVHYRHCQQQRAALRAKLDQIVAELNLKLTHGRLVYEIRPNIDWHKGKAVEYLLTALPLDNRPIVPVYIGDDHTDEDAFRTLRKTSGISIIVADDSTTRPTYAQMRLRDPEEVRLLIEHCASQNLDMPNGVDE